MMFSVVSPFLVIFHTTAGLRQIVFVLLKLFTALASLSPLYKGA